MKRLFALILAVSMLLSMASVGFAEGTATPCDHEHATYTQSTTNLDKHNVYCSDCKTNFVEDHDYQSSGECKKCHAKQAVAECEHKNTVTKGDNVDKHGTYCNGCNAYIDALVACTWGEWKLISGNKVAERECACGNKQNCAHKWGEYAQATDAAVVENVHCKYCEICGAWNDAQPHDFDCAGKCVACGYTNADKADASKHVGGPNVKGSECIKLENGGHSYTCVNCGKRMASMDWNHQWNETELPSKADRKSDKDGHWYVCKECGGVFGYAAHTAATEYETTADEHVLKCTDCGYVMESGKHDIKTAATCDDASTPCTKCGYIAPMTGHTETWASNETKHWKVCTVCGDKTTVEEDHNPKEDKGKNVYDANGKLICEKCDAHYADNHDHVLVNVAKIEPTCLAKGHTAYQKCTKCDFETEHKEIPSLHEQGDCLTWVEVELGNCEKAAQYRLSCKFYSKDNECLSDATELVYGYKDADGTFHKVNSATAAGNHAWDNGKTTAADCCNNAYTVYTCASCKQIKVVVASKTATGHKLARKTTMVKGTENECKLTEMEYYECSVCGYKTTDEKCKLERKDSEYTFDKVVGETSAVSYKGSIFVDKHYDDLNKVLNSVVKNEHKFGSTTIVDKGCAEGKYEVKVCANCGYEKETLVENTKGNHAHVNELILVGNLPTCTVDGKYYYECPICHKHLKITDKANNKVEEITDKSGYVTEKAAGHTWKKTKSDDKSNCTEYAYEIQECSVCKLSVKLVKDGVITAEEKVYYVENGTETRVELNKNAHDFSKAGELIAGSDKCGETGWYKSVCSRCGVINVDNIISKSNPHSFALVGTATKAPTCKGMNETTGALAADGKGAGTVKCTKCGFTKESDDLAGDLGLKIEHKWVETKLEATCKNGGKPARKGFVCANCGEEKGMTNIPGSEALKHDWTYEAMNDCTLIAAQLKTCKRCGEKEIEESEYGKSGQPHSNIAKVWLTETTCLKDGKYYEYCTACKQFVAKQTDGTYKTVTELHEETDKAKGQHTPDNKKHVEVKATCSNGGYTSDYCTVCGETVISNETKAIAADKLSAGVNGGHKEWKIVDWKIKGDCTQDGVAIYGCSACGKTGADYGLGDKKDGYEKVPAGHDFPSNPTEKDIKNVLIPATCGKDGLGTTVCSRCGAADDTLRTIKATGKHNFGTETVKSNDCTKADVTYYYCLDCHAKDSEYNLYLKNVDSEIEMNDRVVKLGATGAHSYDTKLVTREVSCEQDGGDYKVCTKCGYEELVGDATATKLNHKNMTVTKVVTEATCTQEGKKIEYCLGCGKTIKETAIAKTGHKLVVDEDKSFAGNCIVKGYTVEVCKNVGCGYEKTTPNTGYGEHVYVTDKTWGEADCATKTNGIEKQYCKYHPNDKDAQRYVITNWTDAHEWVDSEITVVPTCDKTGTMKAICSKCGATTYKTIKANGHDWATREVAATCEKGSYIETYCTKCDAVATATEPTGLALGHNMLEKVYVKPTCEKDGYWSTKCSRCDFEKVEKDDTDPAKALGHDYKFAETVEPTCEDKGYDLYKCSRCESTQKMKETNATGKHNFLPVDETIKVPACNEKAITVYCKCSVCGKHEYHKLEGAHKMAGPFVAKNGNTITAIYNVCTVCGEIELIDTVNGFDGFDGCMTKEWDSDKKEYYWTGKHTLAGGVVTDATCEEAGHVTKLYCTKCGTLIADEAEIAAKGHTVVEVAEVPATCTEDGVSAYSYCSVCNKEITKKEVLPAGHKLVEVEAAVEATCTEDGKTASKKCENCDYVEESKVVPAKGHKEVILPAVEPTESSTGLTEGKKCEICGLILVEQKEIAAKEAKLIVPAILRAAGYDKATTVARLYTGAEVKILEAMNENGYYKVEVAGKTGYMHKSYIEIL